MDIAPENRPQKYRHRAKDLTPERVSVLSELHHFATENSHPPSVRELMLRLDLRSPATVQAHLESLERQGLVRREARHSRRWIVTRGGRTLAESRHRAA